MSIAKWVKLFDSLIENFHLLSDVYLKLVWDESIRKLFIDESTRRNFDYYAESMEGMVSGNPRGWYDYKEIQWIEFPHKAKEIESILTSIGQFEYEVTDDKLRLYGYK
jgi:hypothetical protein